MESSFELKSEKVLFPGPSSASAGVKYWEIATTWEHHLLTGPQYLSQFLTRLPFLVRTGPEEEYKSRTKINSDILFLWKILFADGYVDPAYMIAFITFVIHKYS